jgi:hypothetical protein
MSLIVVKMTVSAFQVVIRLYFPKTLKQREFLWNRYKNQKGTKHLNFKMSFLPKKRKNFSKGSSPQWKKRPKPRRGNRLVAVFCKPSSQPVSVSVLLPKLFQLIMENVGLRTQFRAAAKILALVEISALVIIHAIPTYVQHQMIVKQVTVAIQTILVRNKIYVMEIYVAQPMGIHANKVTLVL